MTDIVTRAREYLACNAAKSGADALIAEMADMIEKQRYLIKFGISIEEEMEIELKQLRRRRSHAKPQP